MNKTLEFNHYYGKRKRKSHFVIPNNVLQKGKTFQIRADYELMKNVQDLASELGQTDSKVIKDILEDFFLDQKIARQKYEINNI